LMGPFMRKTPIRVRVRVRVRVRNSGCVHS